MGPFVTAMSAEASDMSSWLLMGLPGVAYLSGICSAAWTAIGLELEHGLTGSLYREGFADIQVILGLSRCLISFQKVSR